MRPIVGIPERRPRLTLRAAAPSTGALHSEATLTLPRRHRDDIQKRDFKVASPALSAAMAFAPLGTVNLEGPLGQAVASNRRGRLSNFITDEHSPPIAIFAPENVIGNTEGDWYGEHAGKWLLAASRAAANSHDPALLANVVRVADYLLTLQDADGYLGNYPPERRFTCPQPPKPETWDGAPALRTWDVWTHTYLVLGLVEVTRVTGDGQYLAAARRIGDLFWRTLADDGINIVSLGNHFGLSATVMIEPAVELYWATGEQRYLDLALLIVEQAETDPRNRFFTRSIEGVDPSEIASGKIYQLLWNMVGLAKLYRATGDDRFYKAIRNHWSAVRDHHLTLGGGPWGGVAHRSREVFNPASVFSVEGYVETCSTMSWIELNGELLKITGEAAFAQEIERAAYNDLLGAHAPDGENWCYYSFPNGRRVHTTYWRCCKSSGAMVLESLPHLAYGIRDDGALSINVLGPSEARIALPAKGTVKVRQETNYPFDGLVRVHVDLEEASRFIIQLRVPDWSDAAIAIGDDTWTAASGTFAVMDREWSPGDVVSLNLLMEPTVHRAVQHNVQESRAPGGIPVSQEVMRFEHMALTKGPLVFATGLIDGYKTAETIRFDGEPSVTAEGENLLLQAAGRPAILFEPYFAVDGRRDQSWRITWMGLAPPPVTPTDFTDEVDHDDH